MSEQDIEIAAPSIVRQVAGVVAGGVAGTLVNALMVSIFLPVAAITMMTSPGRHVIALLLAAILPYLFARFGQLLGWIAGVVVLTLAATLFGKLIFGAAGTWPAEAAFSASYAITAVLVYRYVAYGRA